MAPSLPGDMHHDAREQATRHFFKHPQRQAREAKLAPIIKPGMSLPVGSIAEHEPNCRARSGLGIHGFADLAGYLCGFSLKRVIGEVRIPLRG